MDFNSLSTVNALTQMFEQADNAVVSALGVINLGLYAAKYAAKHKILSLLLPSAPATLTH
mgnify:CR=1 FL=1